VCHGGFDKCSGGEFNRFKFGVGSLYNRCKDWLDWMLVEAWNVEHNQMHHYCLGEDLDPDLVEQNFSSMREVKQPRWMKNLTVYLAMSVWKWYYYAPNTFKQLKIHELRRQGKVPRHKDGTVVSDELIKAPWPIMAFWLTDPEGPLFFTNLEFFQRVIGPYFLRNFLLLPLVFLAVLGRSAAFNAFVSLALAEVLTNLHSFLVIVTNHAGDDLYRFDRHCVARSATFYMRQVTSSVNFRTGNGLGRHPHGFMADLNDFHHGWLNYQIEHHVWPDLSMLSYQKAAPLLRAICEKHHVPYVQESVFTRLTKTVDIMTGATSMRKYPVKWEREADLAPLDANALQ